MYNYEPVKALQTDDIRINSTLKLVETSPKSYNHQIGVGRMLKPHQFEKYADLVWPSWQIAPATVWPSRQIAPALDVPAEPHLNHRKNTLVF